MTRILQAGGLWLAIATIVWLTTIWRWQSTGHDASGAEIVGQLFVLPLLLAATFLLALWGVKRLKQKAASPQASAAPTASAAPMASQAGSADESERQLTAWVLAEAVHLPAGESADAAWTALRTRAMRPNLDFDLQDVDGAPVMTSRVAELDLDGWQALNGALLAADGARLSLSVQRGLALLESPLRQLLSVVGDLVPPEAVRDDGGPAVPSTKAHLSGVAAPVSASARLSREAVAPQLTVRVLLPQHWQAAERDAAVAFLRRQCGPLLDWAEAAQARGVTWHTEALDGPEAFWDEVDQTMLQWSRQARPELLMVLAVDSAIDPACIERMQALGELFTGMHQTGRMPGEGAVGLLLANAQWPGLAEQGDRMPHVPVRMWRPVRVRRDKSADAAGRVGTTALNAAVTHAAALCQANKDSLVVVADADHRASRGAELFESLQEVLPGLDPMLSVARVGESFGELGMARAIAPTALACAALRAGEPPAERALAIHLQSSHDRAVVALAPWSAPVAAAQA